jgi:7-keto-8-aminopelargonate synthetase-like enzyme
MPSNFRDKFQNDLKAGLTETVISMDGDVAPVTEIFAHADRYGAGVIVDEGHAIAVHGPSGRGIAAESGCAEFLALQRLENSLHHWRDLAYRSVLTGRT